MIIRLCLAVLLYGYCGPLSAQATVGLRVLSGNSDLTSPADALPAEIGTHDRVSTTILGLIWEQELTYHLALRTGLQQSQRGTTLQQGRVTKILGAPVPLDYEVQLRMNYVEIPLTLRVAVPVAEQIRFFGWGGATMGYATGGSIRSRSTTSQNFQLTTAKLDMTNYAFPRHHFGFVTGLGFGVDLGDVLQFRFEAEYNRSTREEAMISADSGEHGYYSLHFGAGMVFRLAP
ncbi:MAG: outer membrane beta-barrel protein [Bacteroidota bacterium]